MPSILFVTTFGRVPYENLMPFGYDLIIMAPGEVKIEAMPPPHKAGRVEDPRIYLAAERTFLAWVRTSLALMGFGFLIARFGLLS